MHFPTAIKLLVAMSIPIIATVISLSDRDTCQSSDLLGQCVASYQSRIDVCHANKLLTDSATIPKSNAIRMPPPPPRPCETCSWAISNCKKRECKGGDKKCEEKCLCQSYGEIPMCKRCDWAIRACRHRSGEGDGEAGMQNVAEDSGEQAKDECMCGVYTNMLACYDGCLDIEGMATTQGLVEEYCSIDGVDGVHV